ncbi:GPI-anchored surface protein, putative [Bodo saltans]|uniref:GPI-anchored surface protein, putative n=1 Tax=Bodo saltans TaxID=75058 RepID=A0A0S4KK90_BODSA|nr:GPI-anchored surface protein, putative [Bodo saltans]|eukprot:CUI13368.1 GPI-anchored surface protein, putative [Bodo saltans]
MTNGVPTFLDAPLQLSFGDEFGASQRGTVLGNLLVFIIVGIVSLTAVVVHRCVTGMRRQAISSQFSKSLMYESAAALRLPGAVIVVVVLLLDSLVASSVLLVGYGSNASDIALGAFGLLVVSVLFFVTCYVIDPRSLSFQATALPITQTIRTDESISTHGLRTRIAFWWNRMTTASNEWEARKLQRKQWDPRKLQRKGSPKSLFVEHFGHLFKGCRGGRHWWILVEAFTTIVVSTLSSVVPDAEGVCVVRAWVVLALMSVVLFAYVAAWPMNTHIETGTAILLLCAQVVVIACAIGGVGNVADIIGLSVSISSAAVALLPIAWWLVSLGRDCWSSNKKLVPRDLSWFHDFLVAPPERLSSCSKMLLAMRRSTSIPSAMSFRRNSKLTSSSSESLQLIIELICDARRFNERLHTFFLRDSTSLFTHFIHSFFHKYCRCCLIASFVLSQRWRQIFFSTCSSICPLSDYVFVMRSCFAFFSTSFSPF